MRILIFFLAIFAIAMPASAARQNVTRVKDGDTFEIAGHKTFGLPTSIRVLGIDTPESAMPPAKCAAERDHGKAATLHAKSLVAASGGIVWTTGKVKRDKFNGRYLFKVYLRINGKRVSWGDAMIKAGFALPYAEDENGKLAKPDWCAILRDRQPVDLKPNE
jgi:endonuclease YncB( thermonuclease family)